MSVSVSLMAVHRPVRVVPMEPGEATSKPHMDWRAPVSLGPAALLIAAKAHSQSFGAARALYAPELAPDFNLFALLDAGYELTLSKLLAWLLDPRATHEQGSLFLENFLAHAGLDWPSSDLSSAKIRVEQSLPEGAGRVDVVIRTRDSVVYIENKPWAAHQDQQLRRYLADLASRSEPFRALVYMPGPSVGELLPNPADFEGVAMRAVGWSGVARDVPCEHKDGDRVLLAPSLQGWLDTCRAQCRAPTVTTAIASLQRFLRATFDGHHDMTEIRSLAQLMRNEARIADAFNIAEGLEILKAELMADLCEQLARHKPTGWSLQCILGRGDYARAVLKWPGADDYGFAIEFSNAGQSFKNFIYGLRLDQARQGHRTAEAAALRQRFPGRFTSTTVWWPAHERGHSGRELSGQRLAPADWTNDPAPWERILRDTFAPEVVSLAMEAASAICPDKADSAAEPVTVTQGEPGAGLGAADAMAALLAGARA